MTSAILRERLRGKKIVFNPSRSDQPVEEEPMSHFDMVISNFRKKNG